MRVQYIAREPRLLARPLRPQAHRSAREHSAPRVLRHGRIVSLAGLSTPRGMAASAAPQRRTSCRAAVAAVLSTAVAISPPLQRIIDSTAIVIAHRRWQAPLMRRPCVADSQDYRHDVERNAVARSSRRCRQRSARSHQLRCCLCSCGRESALTPLRRRRFQFQTSDFRLRRPLHLHKSMDTRKREGSTTSARFKSQFQISNFRFQTSRFIQML